MCSTGVVPVLEHLLEHCPLTKMAYLCHPCVQHVSKLRREDALFELIELAWDKGFNPHCRLETGGIRGTRKFIGTPEAQALFSSLNISCAVYAFRHAERGRASCCMLQAVEEYFQKGWNGSDGAKIRPTSLPPVYLQHQGHSVTIVGFERQWDNQVNVLVFDPTHPDLHGIKKLVGKEIREAMPAAIALLESYRRGSKYLRKHDEFEILCLGCDDITFS
ncbi:hypothetical protein CDD83_4344 [Cordyceps sp. RAO-2017]|nr:hypothetical protein CDD83_4344 [Cordyceps sp. RAO-2017]